MNTDYAIIATNITKRFGNFHANYGINIKIKKGEIHALLGENGAGKSTFILMLSGFCTADSGTIEIYKKLDGSTAKIGVVHQHFQLVNVYSVLENIILGCETPKQLLLKKENNFFDKFVNFFIKGINYFFKKIFFFDKEVARKKIDNLSNKYGLKVELNAIIENTTVGIQQKTEILKILYRDADILIFDEPTAVLTPQEIDGLLQIMRNLKSEGKTIIFITHKLNEVMAVADSVSVLCKGKLINTCEIKNTNANNLAEMMVGRTVNFVTNNNYKTISNEVILKVENLFVYDSYKKKNVVSNVSFDVKKGEIVALVGVDGNGQRELVNSITGLQKTKKGKIFFKNQLLKDNDVVLRNKIGISHIPSDRQKYGLILDYDLKNNLILRDFNDFTRYGFFYEKKVCKYSEMLIKKYGIYCPFNDKTIVKSMSGGNQQKVIIARELERKHEFLVASQPTRGVDIGAIEIIHSYLLDQKNKGIAILLVSLELDEVFALSDRILVMYEGEIVGEFSSKEISKNVLGLYMSGVIKQKK